MKSILSLAVAAATLFNTAHAASEPYPAKALLYRDGWKTLTYVGCASSSGSMFFNSTYIYNTQGSCQQSCVSLTGGIKYPILGTTDSNACWCGASEPDTSDLVSDSNCNMICAGYAPDMCGGDGYFSVWKTGEDFTASASAAAAAVEATATSGSSATAKSSSTVTAGPSVVTVINGQTVTATAAAAAGSNSSSSSGPNKAAIAAGVVVGLVLVAALGGGGYLFMRHRRRREIEEEFARNAAVNSFIGGGKPGSSAGNSFNDPRIDPTVLAQRRMSDGSIADNQDYSRRILKVTNA